MGADRRAWPVWVRVGLWKIPTRRLAWVYFWAVILLSTAMVGLGLTVDPKFLAGAFLYLTALWYQQSIRWVDANHGWPNSRPADEDEIDARW